VSIQVKINLAELYKRLPPECRKIVLQYVREKLDEAMLEQMILGSSEEKKEEKAERQ
jgi:hypothetical protein